MSRMMQYNAVHCVLSILYNFFKRKDDAERVSDAVFFWHVFFVCLFFTPLEPFLFNHIIIMHVLFDRPSLDFSPCPQKVPLSNIMG